LPICSKYKSVINTAYPAVDVVMGTDEATSLDMMKIMLKNLLVDDRYGITEELKKQANEYWLPCHSSGYKYPL
jgi:hypothetical protein